MKPAVIFMNLSDSPGPLLDTTFQAFSTFPPSITNLVAWILLGRPTSDIRLDSSTSMVPDR
ncbi:hypothetical protein BDR06DRAFT_963391 [Suillus hirtellus]|nr:hypothetical protein BDR06DRAFT_963391 [Suillus hirtellus]